MAPPSGPKGPDKIVASEIIIRHLGSAATPRRQSAGPETHNPAMRGLESGYAALFQYVRDLSDTPGYGEVDIDAGSPFEL